MAGVHCQRYTPPGNYPLTTISISDDSGALRGQAGQAARVYPRSARALPRAGLYGEPTRPPAAPAAPAGSRGQLPRIHHVFAGIAIAALRRRLESALARLCTHFRDCRQHHRPRCRVESTRLQVPPLIACSYRGMVDVSLLLSTKKSVSVLRMSPIPFSPSRLPPPTPIVARPTMCVFHPGLPNTHCRWQRCPTPGATSRS